MNTTRWPLIAIGCVAALIGACLFVGGAVLLGAQVILRDADGFYTSPELPPHAPARTPSSCPTSTPTSAPGPEVRYGWIRSPRSGSRRSAGDRAVFAGIARSSDVSSYLAGVAHEEFVDIRGRDVVNRAVPGGRHPGTAGRSDLLDGLECRNRNAGPHLAGRGGPLVAGDHEPGRHRTAGRRRQGRRPDRVPDPRSSGVARPGCALSDRRVRAFADPGVRAIPSRAAVAVPPANRRSNRSC